MAGMELLIDTVCKAGSQDPSTVKFAEEKIKEWELDPNFHKALLVSIVHFNWRVTPQHSWF